MMLSPGTEASAVRMVSITSFSGKGPNILAIAPTSTPGQINASLPNLLLNCIHRKNLRIHVRCVILVFNKLWSLSWLLKQFSPSLLSLQNKGNSHLELGWTS